MGTLQGRGQGIVPREYTVVFINADTRLDVVVQVSVEWPYVLVQAIVYSSIVYALIQFEWVLSKYLWFLFFFYFTFLYFSYWGMMCVSITPNAQIAAIMSSAFYGLWNLFAGFSIARPVLPLTLEVYFCNTEGVLVGPISACGLLPQAGKVVFTWHCVFTYTHQNQCCLGVRSCHSGYNCCLPFWVHDIFSLMSVAAILILMLTQYAFCGCSSASTYLVEMVCLGYADVMDIVWSGHITAGGYHNSGSECGYRS